jgi:nucleotide-binding universal stress UspA family protein
MRIDAACVLERAVETARERCGVEVHGLLVEQDPVSALLDSAHDGDLIVVGSRGRGAVKAGLFGSTTNSLLDRSALPVVVVREVRHENNHHEEIAS